MRRPFPEAMNCWAIIPVKAKGEGKSRLAGILSAGDREFLVDAMLAHVVAAARHARTIDRICLLSPSRHRVGDTISLLADRGRGFNAALMEALAGIVPGGPDRLVVIAADLPCVTALDFDLLAKVSTGALGIAPDRHGTGTNALSLPLPLAASFTFRFGTGSCAKHREEAERVGLAVETIHSDGLEKDIDEPADLKDVPQSIGLFAANAAGVPVRSV